MLLQFVSLVKAEGSILFNSFQYKIHVTKPRLDGKIVGPIWCIVRISAIIAFAYAGNQTKMAAAW